MNHFIQAFTGILLLSCLIFAAPSALHATPSGSGDSINIGKIETALADSGLPFIANQGQLDDAVLFYAPTFNGTLFITARGTIVYSLPEMPSRGESKGWTIEEEFMGGCINKITGSSPALTKINFFKGNDPREWISDIPTYGRVHFGEVYAGIALELQAHGNNVERLFHVKAQADPHRIRIRVRGAKGLHLNNAGELEMETELGSVRFTRPVAWQEDAGLKQNIDVAYTVENDHYGFEVGDYDTGLPLIIDPLLASTFLGGSEEDVGYTSALAPNGDLYVAGYTASPLFPIAPGAFQDTYGGGDYDVFVSRFDEDLTTLKGSTFIGGSGYEGWAYLGLTTDGAGNIYLTGNTSSNDFPTTPGAYDDSYNGASSGTPYGEGGDLFISVLNDELTTLLASTFLGGDGCEYCRAIKLDNVGNIYLAGSTGSTDFPATPGAYNEHFTPGGQFGLDVYAACLSGDLTSLVAATYVGGSNDDFVEASSLDADGNVFLSGWTQSTDYPTPNGHSPVYNGGLYDVFISKISPDLRSLQASTYLGGTSWEFGYAMDLDKDGNVFVAGHAAKHFPTTSGAFDETYNGNLGANYGDDVFVSKFDNDLSDLLASTYLGGERWENATSLVIDEEGCPFLAGSTSSSEFPTTSCAYDRSYNGGTKYGGDLFISKLDGDLAALMASTYIGGAASDGSGYTESLILEPEGGVFLAGASVSSDFPITPGAFDPDFNGGDNDVVAVKLDRSLSADPSFVIDVETLSAAEGGTVLFSLSPGQDHANRNYLILGSVSGTEPGFPLPGGLVTLPLNWDVFTDYALGLVNTSLFSNFMGTTDPTGSATASLNAPPLPPVAIGVLMNYAFTFNNPFDFTSNVVWIEIVE